MIEESPFRLLAYRYADAVDRCDGDALAALFVEDGRIVAPNGEFAGHSALRALPDAMRQRYRKTFHAVLNQTVEIYADGVRASATTYCIARHLIDAPGGNHACYEMTLRYADSFVRADTIFLFDRRVLMVDWTQVYQVVPGAHLAAWHPAADPLPSRERV